MNNEFIEIPANKQSLSNRKTLYGVAINDADYIVSNYNSGKQILCPYFRAWRSMIERCYDVKFQRNHPTYKDCSVVSEWHKFSIFKTWIMTQDWKNKCLDKDLLILDNKVYSPDTCVFITHAVNCLINLRPKFRGNYVLGVYKSNKKYKAQCADGVSNIQTYLGTFDTEHEAHMVYCKFKSSLIIKIAEEQQDIRVKNALIERANVICVLGKEL